MIQSFTWLLFTLYDQSVFEKDILQNIL